MTRDIRGRYSIRAGFREKFFYDRIVQFFLQERVYFKFQVNWNFIENQCLNSGINSSRN